MDQRIQILLHEYNSLRAEVLSRYVAQFQSGGVTAIVLLGFLTLMANRGIHWSSVVLIVSDILLFLGVLAWIDVDITKAARRLRELEKEINDLAGGTPLLKWETEHGIGGLIGRPILKWIEERKHRRASSSAKN
jgi:hypothetical protein